MAPPNTRMKTRAMYAQPASVILNIRDGGAATEGVRGKSEVFRTQQRPDKVAKHEGGGCAAYDEVEHGLNLLAKCHEADQRSKNSGCVNNRNDVTHGNTFLISIIHDELVGH